MPDLLLFFFYLYVFVVSSFDLRNVAARVCALPAVAQYGLVISLVTRSLRHSPSACSGSLKRTSVVRLGMTVRTFVIQLCAVLSIACISNARGGGEERKRCPVLIRHIELLIHCTYVLKFLKFISYTSFVRENTSFEGDT
jgi:hypothetical protein